MTRLLQSVCFWFNKGTVHCRPVKSPPPSKFYIFQLCFHVIKVFPIMFFPQRSTIWFWRCRASVGTPAGSPRMSYHIQLSALNLLGNLQQVTKLGGKLFLQADKMFTEKGSIKPQNLTKSADLAFSPFITFQLIPKYSQFNIVTSYNVSCPRREKDGSFRWGIKVDSR